MNKKANPRPLPEHRPNLEYLKDQAKRLQKKVHAEDPNALRSLRDHHPRFKPGTEIPGKLALHDAQFLIARELGFQSWSELKKEVEQRNRAQLSLEEQLVEAVRKGMLEEVQTALADSPRLSRETLGQLKLAVDGVADRSVWHRPQYRDIGHALIAAGVDVSIWTAARLGLLEHVQSCLTSDPRLLEARDPQSRTPLQRAALIYGSDAECEATVDWLIAHGAAVDLHSAAAYSMTKFVAEALAIDSSQVHRKVQGSTPLNWAVRPRHRTGEDTAVCRILLDHGSDLETEDDEEHGMHPMHHLGEWGGNEKTVELLLARGGNLQATDNIGWTPLDYAIDRKRESMIACFRRHGAKQTLVDWPNTWGERRDLVFASAKRNDLKNLRRLLEEDPSLANARAESGETPLHWPAHDGHYEVAELLLAFGADVTAQETRYWGGTPLHWASERQPVLVELLLRHGADINSRNARTGQTPLHYCARCDDVPEVAELLLAKGADGSLTDGKGYTPLDYAIKSNHPLVTSILQTAQK